MAQTKLRRRRADAYRVVIPPAATATHLEASAQAAWDAAGDRVVYHRAIGQWLYRPGGNPALESDLVDLGHRRAELAHVPLAALPFSDPLLGTLRFEHYRVAGATPYVSGHPAWAPWVTVHALAVSLTGDVALYWHRADEWPLPGGNATLRVDRYSAAGVRLGGQEIDLSEPTLGRAPIACAWGLGVLWAIEPQPAPAAPEGTLDGHLPVRIVRRNGAALGVSDTRDLPESEAAGWPGGDSICPDLTGDVGAWAIINRRFFRTGGPFPSGSGPGVYDVSYLLPLTNALVGDEALLTFGHGADRWHMDEPYAFGRSTVLDTLAGGVPRFVSIGFDPDAWPAGDVGSQIWRWRYEGGAETREAGAGRSSASYGGGWYRRSLHRLAAGSYLVHPGGDAPVSALTLESLP